MASPIRFKEKTNDAFITTKVKASLVDAKDLFANSIKVVTHRGTVYLMGRLTEREASRATEVARGVPGLVKVVRVFEILTESDLANSQPRSLGHPDTPAVPPGPPPAREPAPAATSSPRQALTSAAERRTLLQVNRLIRLDVSRRLPPDACTSA